jgi:hypothetical protein
VLPLKVKKPLFVRALTRNAEQPVSSVIVCTLPVPVLVTCVWLFWLTP